MFRSGARSVIDNRIAVAAREFYLNSVATSQLFAVADDFALLRISDAIAAFKHRLRIQLRQLRPQVIQF